MKGCSAQKDISELIFGDKNRMEILKVVRDLDLPDCYVAAGFVRNRVWNALYNTNTPLNDIDVVFYDMDDQSNRKAGEVEEFLKKKHPQFQWDVKNQAFTHLMNGDSQYKNTLDAMSYWPEKETAVGAFILESGKVSVVSPFDLEGLLQGKITHNPKRDRDIFLNRVKAKRWLEVWPNLEVII